MNKSISYQDKPWLKHYDEGVPASLDYDIYTLPDTLAETVATYPDRIAFLFQGYEMSYREFGDAVKRKPFPIVALGASAGGLEAFEAFFKAMRHDSGMAFVLIAHLDPTHVSLLPELLQKRSRMKVHQAQDGMQVQPDHVPQQRTLACPGMAGEENEFVAINIDTDCLLDLTFPVIDTNNGFYL